MRLYPGCYHGIENVVHYLASSLYKAGHHVELFTVGGSTTRVSKKHWYHKEEQYKHIHRPWYEATSVTAPHILYALEVIRRAGDFDIIHDHNSFMGPAMLSSIGDDLPPALHTLHEPFTDERLLGRGIPDNRLLFKHFKPGSRLHFNVISQKQLDDAPRQLKGLIHGIVHNGVDLDFLPFSSEKEDYFINVGRIARDKGQGLAARVCDELGEKFKMAGTVTPTITTARKLARALADIEHIDLWHEDLAYYAKEILPHTAKNKIEYLGIVTGEAKQKLFAKAKAYLAPYTWEEPFGMSIIDALASGTPVIAYRRGALPEIIEHGVNGFLADDARELRKYIQRIGEIDPAACRKTVEERFSADRMAEDYARLYREIIAQSA
ncbi:MAG TPA: glycosyltransferase [Candidatus Saccharimonadales bacterium]|nr:glycosyltransferase [Candidatus Saccharimonadales bacterium]